ncbi:MAG TPA: CBS domain-containing protein [Thermoanaerobaculia bacterium]|nr:CBS domain-containing protein [Thermoanaerobaculia bacterium]
MAKSARDIMSSDPACVTPVATAQEAAGLMETHDVGSLPVVESESSKRLLGIVTDRDLALRVLGRGESGNTPVSEVMSKDLHCARQEDDLDKVERLMAEHQVRRIPVLDEQDRLVGMIAQADLARERRAVGDKDFAKVVEQISEPAGVGR